MREMVEKGRVLLEKVDIVENVVDMLTKSISTQKFSWCRNEMGLTTLFNWTEVPYLLKTAKKKQVGEC